MGILSRVWKNSDGSSWPYASAWLQDLLGGRPTFTGIQLSEMKAMQSTAVYACVTLLARTIATMPLGLNEMLPGGGKARAPTHPLYRVLHSVANPEMASFILRETLQGHLGLWGNAYAEIEYSNGGDILALWPLRPDRTKPVRDPVTKELKYQTRLNTGETLMLPYNRVFHIPGFGFDGLVGYNPIDFACQSISLGLAAEEHAARFFGNGATVGGVLEHPGELGEEGRKNVRQSFEEMHEGLSKSHRLLILEEGMEYKQIGIPPQTAQLMETRKFQINDIARFYNVPPHMIGDLQESTNNNIEQQSLDFVKNTMMPWFTRWEQQMDMRLLSPNDQKRYFTKFNLNALLRGDSQARSEYYAKMFSIGAFSINKILELEDENGIGPEGDVHLVPLNMIPVERVNEEIDRTLVKKGGEKSNEKVLESLQGKEQ